MNTLRRLGFLGVLSLLTVACLGQAAPAAWPTADGTYTIDHFQFKDGETIDHLRLHYLTLGQPHRDAAGHVDNAVLLLHGTGGDAHSLLNPLFSNVQFVPGGVLDITKYFLILPDDIGHGKSSKPSDGLHMRFPQYTYADMVHGEYHVRVGVVRKLHRSEEHT